MSTNKHINGEWATMTHRTFGIYTGHIRKRKGRWWFFGDARREVKIRLSSSQAESWVLDKHKAEDGRGE